MNDDLIGLGINKGFINRPCGIEIGFARICVTNQNTNTSSLLSNSKQQSLEQSSKICYEKSKSLCKKQNKFNKNPTVINTNNCLNNDELQATSEVKMNFLAPCFRDLLKNENLPYLRYDISFDDDLTKLVNTTNEASNAKMGLFLKSLNKNVLSKNANKDAWSLEIESMWVDFTGQAFSKSSASSKSAADQNCSLSQNTSFKIYLINVWNFYKSTPCADDSATSNANSRAVSISSSMKRDSLDLVLNNSRLDSIELESFVNNSNYFHQENFDRAFSRLSNVIKINEIVKSSQSSSSTNRLIREENSN